MEFAKSQRAVENREKWRKLVAKSVVPQRSSRLRNRWDERFRQWLYDQNSGRKPSILYSVFFLEALLTWKNRMMNQLFVLHFWLLRFQAVIEQTLDRLSFRKSYWKRWTILPTGRNNVEKLSNSVFIASCQKNCQIVVSTRQLCQHTAPEGSPGMSDVSPLSGISGLSVDPTLLSPVLFFCLVLLSFLSDIFLPAGPSF